jgi:hypothetical protein
MGDEEINLGESLRLLVAIADAYATTDEIGRREPLIFFRRSRRHELQHPAFPQEDWPIIDEETLDRLASQGVIRLDYGEQTDKVYVTEEGERTADQARRVLKGDDEPEPEEYLVELGWETVARPVLEAVYGSWTARGAPADGVLTSTVIRSLGDSDDVAHRTRRAVALLVEAGYLDAAGPLYVADAPATVVVTSRGLQVVGGWPATTAEAATHALLVALDRAIEETTEPERKTKLQRLREVVLDVGQGTLAEVLARVVTGGV